MSIRALIVDDEEKARNVLQALIQENFPDIEIIGMAGDVPDAVKAINRQMPDVIFLDIEMPGYSGFQLLDFFDNIPFRIIFTTAYSEYAIQAFQVSAVDFLLKPIQIDQLESAVDKLRERNGTNHKELYDNLKLNISGNTMRRIALPTSSGILFIKPEEIVYLKADGSYTHFILHSGKEIVVSKRIKEYESALTPEMRFYRPHRSYIVNAERITEFVKADGGSVLMDNGHSIPVSRDSKDEFLGFLGVS